MAKVILTCGRICSGKTTYSEILRRELPAVVLSVDEIMLALFTEGASEMHDTYVERAKSCLFDKSVQITDTGINVVLDLGLWTKEERRAAREFYAAHGIRCELHYICVPDDEWHRRIEKRNAAVMAGECPAYYVDKGLEEKFASIFEPPTCDEVDIIIGESEGL